MSEFQIVEYQAKDRSDCINLLKRTFPGSSDEKTFAWRFESLFTQKPLIICAKDYDKVVSFNSWLCWEFQHNNNRYIGYQSGESATDEFYRGKGIFSDVLQHADDIARSRNIDFFFGFPSDMSYKAFYRVGYCPIGVVNNFYIRIVNPFIKPLTYNAHNEIKAFSSLYLSEKNTITPVVNSQYAHWRYLDNPKSYDILEFKQDGNHAAFVIRKSRYYNKKYKFGWSEGLMLDCQLSSLNDVFVGNAFKYLDSIYARKIFCLRTFCNPNTARGNAIAKHFQVRLGSKYETLILKLINERLDYNLFYDYNNWDIMPHVKDES